MRAKIGAILIGLTALSLLAIAACGGDDAGATRGNTSGITGAVAAQSSTPVASQGITVSGEGTVTVKPDTATLSIGVSTLAKTARESRDQAASEMNKLLDSLKSSGVDEKDITTTQFNLNAEYNYAANIRTFNGYRVIHIVSAKIRNVDRVADTLDAAVDATGNDLQIGSVAFMVGDPKQLASQARTAAMADAASKAQQLADAGGVRLGKPVSVTETSTPSPMPFAALAGGVGAASASTTIEPGQLEVTVSVQVTYATG